jgi:hypothetical protein
MTGKLVTFHIKVSALISASDRERIEAMVKSKQAQLQDAVNVVVRGAAPEELNEPGLITIRRYLKREFDRILCDSAVVKQVLIPQLLQSGSGV